MSAWQRLQPAKSNTDPDGLCGPIVPGGPAGTPLSPFSHLIP